MIEPGTNGDTPGRRHSLVAAIQIAVGILCGLALAGQSIVPLVIVPLIGHAAAAPADACVDVSATRSRT